MSDLIRREDAIEVAYQLRHKPNDDEWNEEWLHSFNAIPTIDAVSVVRCGECKHMYDGIKGDGYLICHKFNHFIKADDFCSYGEPNER